MNCSNCNIMRQDVPCIPQGNDFKIAIVLKEKIKTDGEVSERDINILNNQVSVSVIKPDGDAVDNPQNVYSVALNGSTVVISFPYQGKSETGLPKGKYGIEVTGKRSEDSSDFCFSLPIGYAFEIVAYSTQGYFPSDSIITYTVDGVVGVAQNVSSGGGGSTEQVQADWNETNTSSKAFIKNKPTIPNAYTKSEINSMLLDYKTNDEAEYELGNLQAAIDTKEGKLTLETPTLTNNVLNAQFGKYYILTLSAQTTINLPAVTGNETTLGGFLIYLTINTGGSVDWNANGETIMDSGLSSIQEGKTYEVNAAWNGLVWAITAIELTEYSTT